MKSNVVYLIGFIFDLTFGLIGLIKTLNSLTGNGISTKASPLNFENDVYCIVLILFGKLLGEFCESV